MTKIQILLLILAILLLGSLRIYNLGYSEYIPDETTVLSPVKDKIEINYKFLSIQKKGPMQFLIAKMVHFFGYDPDYEFVYRLPYTIISIFSLIFVFLTIYEFTKIYSVSLVTMLLMGTNGFLVAFSRIVQYQSLNMLFSFAGLYFYSKLLNTNRTVKKYYLYSFLGLSLLFLSLASHWDAVFFLPLYLYIFIKHYNQNKSNKPYLINYALIHLIYAFVIFIPFIVVYFGAYLRTETHQNYFSGRIGISSIGITSIKSKINEYLFRNELYNPFYYLPVLIGMVGLSLVTIKKSWIFFIWFLFSFILFIIFVKKPGTHVYNMYLPLSVLAGYGFWVLTKIFRNIFVLIPSILLLFCLSFFYYQNYLLFVDPSVEYPWSSETIYKSKTRTYDHLSLSNNIIGFPLRRNWVAINKIVQEDINKRDPMNTYTFVTNEVKSISNYYIDIPYGLSKNTYAIGIKRPFSYENDYSFPQYHNRKTIAKLEYNGSMVARIYFIENEQTNREL